MELQELRKEPHLSASAINDYIDCSLQFRFSRIDRLEPEFTPESLEFGSIMHLVLADFYREKMDGKKLTLKKLHSLFTNYCKEAVKENEDIKFGDGHDFETFLSQGKALLTTYYEKLPENDFRVVSVEEPFKLRIEALDVPVIGVTDLVEEDKEGTIIITDWKTSASSYSSDRIDKNFQLTVYYMALKANGYADREILLRIDCLIKTRTPKFEQYYTTRTELDEKRAIRKIAQVWDGIRKGVFIPNDSHWKCNGCSYKTYCDEWFIAGGE